jgi:SAM-dependent methyltransferase
MEYERFAAFYDAVMDDPLPRALRVRRFIDRYMPGATSLLELACGTGSILAHLTAIESLTGLDRSPQMLDRARMKVPRARLVQGDMVTATLDERFDVVICVFDSLNHVLDVASWWAVFDTAHRHLVEGGLFIVDVNTVGELERLAREPPWAFDFDDGLAVMDVTMTGEGLSLWDIRIFEHVGESQYLLHHEEIGELGLPLDQVRSALSERFAILEEEDEDGGPPTDDSLKAHFACRRRQ